MKLIKIIFIFLFISISNSLANNIKDFDEWKMKFKKRALKNDISEKTFDVVMSDMAVNTTGIKNIDSIQTGELCKEAMIFSSFEK